MKAGARYPYYVSRAVIGGRKNEAGSVARVAAMEVERVVCDALGTAERSESATRPEALGLTGGAIASPGAERTDEESRTEIALHIAHIIVRKDAIQIDLTEEGEHRLGEHRSSSPGAGVRVDLAERSSFRSIRKMMTWTCPAKVESIPYGG